MADKPDTSLREQLWGMLPCYSHSPEPCSATDPCDLCKRSVEQLAALVRQAVVEALDSLELPKPHYYTSFSTPEAKESVKNVEIGIIARAAAAVALVREKWEGETK